MPADSPQALSSAFAAAINAGDVPAALELWVEDAALLQGSGKMVRGRAAIGAALQALVEHRVSLEIEVERIFSAGAVAIATGSLTMSGVGADGGPFSQASRSVVVYSQATDGSWRVAIDAPWGLPGA